MGSSITITGTEFGATQGASTVVLDQVQCAVTSWSDTSITFTVPNDANTGQVYLHLQQELDCGLLTVGTTAPAQC
jgi:hypothetical protein